MPYNVEALAQFGHSKLVCLVANFHLKKQNKTDNEKPLIKHGHVSLPKLISDPMLKTNCPARIAPNVQGLLLWGIVAVSAPAQNLIKETNFYLNVKPIS